MKKYLLLASLAIVMGLVVVISACSDSESDGPEGGEDWEYVIKVNDDYEITADGSLAVDGDRFTCVAKTKMVWGAVEVHNVTVTGTVTDGKNFTMQECTVKTIIPSGEEETNTISGAGVLNGNTFTGNGTAKMILKLDGGDEVVENNTFVITGNKK